MNCSLPSCNRVINAAWVDAPGGYSLALTPLVYLHSHTPVADEPATFCSADHAGEYFRLVLGPRVAEQLAVLEAPAPEPEPAGPSELELALAAVLEADSFEGAKANLKALVRRARDAG
jgi:hypothetical protein